MTHLFMENKTWIALFTGIRLVLAIRLHVSPPSLTCDVGQTAQFKCTIDDCFDNASFFWYQKHIFGNGTEGELKSINIGRKFSVNKTKLASTLVIEAVEIADAGPFICKVLCFQKKMVYANKTSLLVVKALPKLHLHTQISADDPSIVTLICSAVDFYPPSIIFIWDHSLPGVLNGSEQTEPTLLQQGTYSSNSSLQVRTSQWTPGTEIACVVNHSSVTQPLREGIWRRADLHTSKWHSLLLVTFLLTIVLALFLACWCQLSRHFTGTSNKMSKEMSDCKLNLDEEQLHYASINHNEKSRRVINEQLPIHKEYVYSAVKIKKEISEKSEVQ